MNKGENSLEKIWPF